MFVDDITDVYIFKIIVLFITGVASVIVGNWLYDKRKEK